MMFYNFCKGIIIENFLIVCNNINDAIKRLFPTNVLERKNRVLCSKYINNSKMPSESL